MEPLFITFLAVLGWFGAPLEAYNSGFYADDNSLGQTVLVDRLPGAQKRAIKQEILHLLGLHKKPRPSSHGKHDSAPNYMLDLYSVLEEDSFDIMAPEGSVKDRLSQRNLTMPGMESSVDSADMIMSIVNHVSRAHWLRHERRRSLYFEFKEIPPEQSILGAELRIFKKATDDQDTLTIEMFRLKEGDSPEQRVLEFEANTTVYSGYEGWVDLNVTGAASQWTINPATNYGLYMRISNSKGEIDPPEAGLQTRKRPEDRQPFLVAFFKANLEVRSRKPRSAQKDEGKTYRTEVTMSDEPALGYRRDRYNGRVCQRRTLYVSFKDLNWQEWIIAPEGYKAYYCNGECSFPRNVHMNATNHAIVQTLVHMMNPMMVPQPSCAPTKLSAISVLYFDDNSNVILKKYKNMVVRACGCH